MKSETLSQVLEAANSMKINLSGEAAVKIAESAEYQAAAKMGTSGQPDWLAPWKVTDASIEAGIKRTLEMK